MLNVADATCCIMLLRERAGVRANFGQVCQNDHFCSFAARLRIKFNTSSAFVALGDLPSALIAFSSSGTAAGPISTSALNAMSLIVLLEFLSNPTNSGVSAGIVA